VNGNNHETLLKAALGGDRQALGELLEDYQAYLIVLAQRYLDPRLRGRLDPADIVQVTFLEAQRDLADFRGQRIEELLGWLRNILRHNISSAHQNHLAAQKRSAGREQANHQADDRPALTDLASSETTSPSQRLMRDEAAVHLANCLQTLPESQREAIRLRYVEGQSLKEISQRMDKSEMAVAGLLKRGLQTLRDRMLSDSSSHC
jgi:RNA polymerase sigma-70 factor (ECF subfamily)